MKPDFPVEPMPTAPGLLTYMDLVYGGSEKQREEKAIAEVVEAGRGRTFLKNCELLVNMLRGGGIE